MNESENGRRIINIIGDIIDEKFWVYDECLNKLRFRFNPDVVKILLNYSISRNTIITNIYPHIETSIDIGLNRIIFSSTSNGFDGTCSLPDAEFIIPTDEEFRRYDMEKYEQVFVVRKMRSSSISSIMTYIARTCDINKPVEMILNEVNQYIIGATTQIDYFTPSWLYEHAHEIFTRMENMSEEV